MNSLVAISDLFSNEMLLELKLSNKRKIIYNMCYLNSRHYDRLFRHDGNLSPRICQPCHNTISTCVSTKNKLRSGVCMS